MSLGLRDTYSVVAHVRVVLSLEAMIAMFLEKSSMDKILLVLRVVYFCTHVHSSSLLFLYFPNAFLRI